MRNDHQVQDAVKNLFTGIAPEREGELSELWAKYCPRFNILADIGPEGSFVFDAGAYRDVRFNHRAMRAFWLASFIAWEGYRAVAEGVEKNNIDLGKFNEMTDCFLKLLEVDDAETVPLPSGVPEPGEYPDRKVNPQMRAAAELATFAAGWALLHEVSHLKHQQEGTAVAVDDPSELWRDEEFSCDSFASTFLLDEINKYALKYNEPADIVYQKREIGIYFALFAITLIGHENWSETDKHPAIDDRIQSVMKHMSSNGTRTSDAVAHMAFVALWSRWPDAPGAFKNHKTVDDTLP